MKKFVLMLIVFSLLIASVATGATAISNAPSNITLKDKETEKLYYFDPKPDFLTPGAYQQINAYVYRMGEIIYGEIDESQSGVWYAVLRDLTGNNILYTSISGGRTFSIVAGALKDGKYKIVATDSLISPAWEIEKEVYIKYNVDLSVVDIKQCSYTSTLQGTITIGNGIAPSYPLDVLVAYPSLKLAAKYSISAISSGQFSISFASVPDYGMYYIYINDSYPTASPDNDSMIYYFIPNYSTVQWKLSEIVPNTPLYNDEEGNLGQSIVLMLKDTNGKLITGKKDRFVIGMSWISPSIKEISEGVYKIYGGRLTGNSVSIYVKDVLTSNTIVKNLVKLSHFNPYIYVDAEYSISPYGTGTYYDYYLGKNIYDKLPLSNGNSLEIRAGVFEIPDIADPANKKFTLKDNYYVYKYFVTFSPSIELHKIGPDIFSVWNDPSQNILTKPIFYVKDSSNVSVKVQAVVWKRANQDSTPTWKQVQPDPYNACCVYNMSENYTLSGGDITACSTTLIPQEFTINEQKDLSVNSGNSFNIVHIYVIDENGNKIKDSMSISSKGGTERKTISEAWFNPLHIQGTNIPELPINFGYDDTLDITFASGNVIFKKLAFNTITTYPMLKYKVVIEIFSKLNNTYPLCSILKDTIKVSPIIKVVEGSYDVISTGGKISKELLAGLKESILIYGNFTYKNIIFEVMLNGKSLEDYGLNYSYTKISEGQFKITFNKPIPYDENYSPNELEINVSAFSDDIVNEELLSISIDSKKAEKDTIAPEITIFEPQNNSFVNSKTVKVKGKVTDNFAVASLILNGIDTTFNENGGFETEIALTEGENTIKIEAEDIAGNKKTAEIKITCDTIPPDFSFDVPAETTLSEIEIKGNTEKDAKIYFREKELANTNGQFSVKVPLTSGKNFFYFSFIDRANNKSKITISITKIVINTIVLTIGKTTMFVNSKPTEIDPGRKTVPIIKEGRTLVPIRAIIEAFSGSIQWDKNEKKVTVTLGSNKIELWIGKSTARVNGIEKPIDSENSNVVPEIINGRTMLPVRFITENLGCSVKWDPVQKTVTVTYIE